METGALFVLHLIALAFLGYHKFMADSFEFSLLFFEFWGSSLENKEVAGMIRRQSPSSRIARLVMAPTKPFKASPLELDGVVLFWLYWSGDRRRIGCQEGGMSCFSRRPFPPRCCSSPQTKRCGPDPQSPTRDRGLRSSRRQSRRTSCRSSRGRTRIRIRLRRIRTRR